MSGGADLLADRGEAAAGEEFFRSPEFLAAEAVTHTLRLQSAAGEELLFPVVVREVGSGPERDAISPYGYPGAAGAAASPIDPDELDLSSSGLVSAFLRHRLGAPPLRGARARNQVLVADPALPRKSRGSDRNRINRNRREGYETSLTRGPETTVEQRAGFLAAYEQTMRRTGAAPRYFFDAAYFDRILGSHRAELALVRSLAGDVAAGSIVVESDGYLHYYLSGTADAHLRASPMKNAVEALVDLAIERRLPLNLGGGIEPGDRLEEFKRGFANRAETWRTSELVCDRPAYERLSAGTDAGAFFPAYRAS